MSWFWWLIGFFVLLLWIFAIVDIIRRRHERTTVKTVAWILLVIVVPVLGTLTYFLVNGVGGPVGPREAEIDRMTGERY